MTPAQRGTLVAGLIALGALTGCSLNRGGLEDEDTGPPRDAGGVDAGGMDSGGVDAGGVDSGGVDAGTDGGTDAGTDAGPPPVTIVDLAVGEAHTCALLSTGEIYCWGANNKGQLGSGDTAAGVTPRLVVADLGAGPTPVTDATAITSGWSHSCMIRGASREVWCWGAGGNGRLGDGGTMDRTQAVRASTLVDALGIATGKTHSCALLGDGTARCWGQGANGRLGDGLGVDSPTPVVVVDRDSPSMPLPGVTTIAAGESFACALGTGSGAWCWGKDDANQIGAGNPGDQVSPLRVVGINSGDPPLSGLDGIALGLNFAVVFDNGSTTPLLQWGANGTGLPFAVAVASGQILEVSAGFNHACLRLLGLGSDVAEARCWGSGMQGQLGNGGFATQSSPALVVDDMGMPLMDVTRIAAGGLHSCAVVGNERVFCWGSNTDGQLGSTGGMRADALEVPGFPP